jgi:hypothetical protein
MILEMSVDTLLIVELAYMYLNDIFFRRDHEHLSAEEKQILQHMKLRLDPT